jgi:phosphotransferase system HPr (HPr) family protein
LPSTEQCESSTEVILTHPPGLHLRFGKDVVVLASQFESTILVRNVTRETTSVSARSIIQLMTLQARQGHRLLVLATGPDATEAVRALADLLTVAPEVT